MCLCVAIIIMGKFGRDLDLVVVKIVDDILFCEADDSRKWFACKIQSSHKKLYLILQNHCYILD